MEAEYVQSVYHTRDLPPQRLTEIAVAGRSNVGKSSLLNQLTGRRQLAKTSSTPGKTRCLNYFLIHPDSARDFYIVDLPGYGYARVSKEMRGDWDRLIDAYLAAEKRPSGLIALFDSRRESTETDRDWLGWLSEWNRPYLVVLTKSDKLSNNERAKSLSRWRRAMNSEKSEPVMFSAVNSEGKDKIWQWIDRVRKPRAHH
jgi:GTP-binding protein